MLVNEKLTVPSPVISAANIGDDDGNDVSIKKPVIVNGRLKFTVVPTGAADGTVIDGTTKLSVVPRKETEAYVTPLTVALPKTLNCGTVVVFKF